MSDHEDLEDGEIEDDDEDVPVPSAVPVSAETDTNSGPVLSEPAHGVEAAVRVRQPRTLQSSGDEWDKEERVQEIKEKVQNVKNAIEAKAKPPKRSKPSPVVDDWATSVENAIANALKKDGVQPPMPSLSNRGDEKDGEIPSKRRKRDRPKKKPAPEKTGQAMDEMDLEYEMMNVRGGSPRPQQTAGGGGAGRTESEDSYSSDESRGRRRDRDRERDREYNRRKRKNRQRNRANRDNRKRKRDESDDDKHHVHNRHNGPRKMELCKFYLMDCCAKREKCLYMHSDFPCKYYYLGLKCKEKEKCLFSHGEPLSDELRAILMKHLETAPQEILGDFPRINRESAITMVNATHRKLSEKFGLSKNKNMPPEAAGAGESGKNPLLEMSGSSNRGGDKNRRSRWCEKNANAGSSNGKPGSDGGAGDHVLSLKYLNGVISQEQIENLEQMGIHNLDQISQLTVAQLNDLGLSISQIHELQMNSMNMQKFRGNVAAKHGIKSDDPKEDLEAASSGSSMMHSKDQDMRVTPSHVAELQKGSESSNIGPLGGKDVDMRFLPMVNTTAQEAASANDHSNSQSGGDIDHVSTSLSSLIKTPTVDYSQYLKDSNLNDDDFMDGTENVGNLLIAQDDDDDDDDDENNLKISIEEEEHEADSKRHKSGSLDEERYGYEPPQPAVFDTRSVSHSLSSSQKIDYTESFGMYKPTDEMLDKPTAQESCILDRYGSDSESSAKKKPDTFTTRKSMYSLEPLGGAGSPSYSKQAESPSSSLGWTPTSSSTAATPAPCSSSNTKVPAKPARPSIYDDPYASDNSEDSDSKSKSSLYTERDKDMRLSFLTNLDAKIDEDSALASSSSDVDLRLPFKPIMTNYIPATEIDGSITSHAPILYKVHEVDIPKPNYKDIRRNTPRPERTKDPRLRRIFGMYEEDDIGSASKAEPLLQGMRSPKPSTPMSPVASSGPIAPRVDPRTKRMQENRAQAAVDSSSSTSSSNNTRSNSTHLDVQAILQRSNWYTDLNSKHKIMVNQQLAILSTEMKKYHNSDKSTDKLADFMQSLAGNQMLQFILTNLNVYVDDSVAFCEVPLVPSQPPPFMTMPPPNLGMPVMLPPVNIPPPGTKPPSLFDLPRFNCPPEVRPGLLGVAPNMPFEQFLAMGQVNKTNNPPPLLDDWSELWDDEQPSSQPARGPPMGGIGPGGSGFNSNYDRAPNNFGNSHNRGNNMRNNNRSGGNFRNNDRWNNSGGGNQNRRNNNNHRRMDKKK